MRICLRTRWRRDRDRFGVFVAGNRGYILGTAFPDPNSGPVFMTTPMTLADLAETFELLDDWEERYTFIIDLGRKLEPMPDGDRIEANKVRGCLSQVWLTAEARPADGGVRLHFRADSDAHIVKGLIAILLILFNDRTPDEIAALDAEAELQRLGLDQHISPNRRNGITAMIHRIKDAAARPVS